MNYTPEPPPCEPASTYLIQPATSPAYAFLGVCPYAQTLSALSLTHDAPIVFALSCRRWTCRVCAETKIKRLACTVRRAKPTRLLTLTIDPKLYESPRAAFEATAKKVPILIRKLRERFGEVEYLRVTEVTKHGWPHYHLLVRSGYLPQAVVKSLWRQMTGAVIVDLRKVNQSFRAYQYLVKYLSKLHKIEWTERHVSMSRGFAVQDDEDPKNPIAYALEEFHSFHPALFLAERFEGLTVKRLSARAFLILPEGKTDV